MGTTRPSIQKLRFVKFAQPPVKLRKEATCRDKTVFFPRRKKASEQPEGRDRTREGVVFDQKSKRLPLAYRHVFLSCFRSRRRSGRPRQDIRRRRARSQKKRARRVLGRLEKKKTRAKNHDKVQARKSTSSAVLPLPEESSFNLLGAYLQAKTTTHLPLVIAEALHLYTHTSKKLKVPSLRPGHQQRPVAAPAAAHCARGHPADQ